MIVDKANYVDGVRHECGDLSESLAVLRSAGRPTDFLWLGLKDPDEQELAFVRTELDVHPLALEDIADPGRARAKVDYYENTVVAVMTSLEYHEASSDIESGVIKVVVGENYVLTVRSGEVHPLGGLRQRLQATPHLLRRGPFAVLHGVLDALVDSYLEIEAEVENDLVEIEVGIFADGRAVETEEIYRLKREILEYKHAAGPLARPLLELAGEDSRVEDPELRRLFSDVSDHLLLAVDQASNHDNLLSDILSAHLTLVQVQQNEDMRKIAAWAALAAVPTMVAGIYGMNFENMPELSASIDINGHPFQYGYFVTIAFILGMCWWIYRMLRRRHWL